MKISITAANSSVGRNLLGHVAGDGRITAVAVVRSASAAKTLPKADNIQVEAADYRNVASLAKAFQGCDSVIHLAGVLFEGKGSSYQQANIDTTSAVVSAAREAGVRHLLFVSVLGADSASANAYFRSKGVAEKMVVASGIAATVIRTPILLSPQSAGGQALLREAGNGHTRILGGGHHVVRPLDVDDLSAAMLQACRQPPREPVIHELTGPEPVAYADLVRQMAAQLGKQVEIGAIPVWSAKLLSGLSYAFKGSGMSPAIIEVITSSEAVADNADEALGISLTPLAQTLAKLSNKETVHV